jgi:hypothetical protein
MIKSRRMRWVGHVACMSKVRYAYKILVRKPEGKRTLRYLGINGRIFKEMRM